MRILVALNNVLSSKLHDEHFSFLMVIVKFKKKFPWPKTFSKHFQPFWEFQNVNLGAKNYSFQIWLRREEFLAMGTFLKIFPRSAKQQILVINLTIIPSPLILRFVEEVGIRSDLFSKWVTLRSYFLKCPLFEVIVIHPKFKKPSNTLLSSKKIQIEHYKHFFC